MVGKAAQRLFLWIPQDPLHQQSGNQFYSQRLDKFSLGKHQCSNITVPESPNDFPESSTLMLPLNYRPNSHLYLLAMVDCWAHLGINSYVHLDLVATPTFRLFLGVVKHLFRSLTLLESECTAFGELRSLA